MSGFLLDTHFVIWALMEPEKIAPRFREILETAPDVQFSSISILEIGIKKSVGKLRTHRLPSDFFAYALKYGWTYFNVDIGCADLFSQLPLHHRDPYDRMLIAQAQARDLTLLSVDPWFENYGIKLFS